MRTKAQKDVHQQALNWSNGITPIGETHKEEFYRYVYNKITIQTTILNLHTYQV